MGESEIGRETKREREREGERKSGRESGERGIEEEEGWRKKEVGEG